MIELIHGDCLEHMSTIPDESIDMILCDLPYGTTACKWDTVIPFEPLWTHYKRVIKKNGAIVLFGSQPFTSALVASNFKGYAFHFIWDKCFGANFVQAKRQPIKDHEDILVFSKTGKQPSYYPQMIKRDKPITKGGNKQSEAIPIAKTNTSIEFGKAIKTYDEKFPTSQLRFNCRHERGLHPTQKPVALMEYLIKTYTNEGETVLDNCMGSGSTGVACTNSNRRFIGIEKDETYFNIAKKRIFKEENIMIENEGVEIDRMDLLTDWYKLSTQLKDIKKREFELREQVFKLFFPDPKVGTNTFKLPNSHALKASYKLSTKLDIEGFMDVLAEMEDDPEYSEDFIKTCKSVVIQKPTFSETIYKKLPETEKSVVNICITVKPEAVALSIEQVKK